MRQRVSDEDIESYIKHDPDCWETACALDLRDLREANSATQKALRDLQSAVRELFDGAFWMREDGEHEWSWEEDHSLEEMHPELAEKLFALIKSGTGVDSSTSRSDSSSAKIGQLRDGLYGNCEQCGGQGMVSVWEGSQGIFHSGHFVDCPTCKGNSDD